MHSTDFSTLPLHTDLLSNLTTLGYDEMTPIQAQSLPFILAGKDVIAQGKTGSGKTAAFGLGLLQKLNVKILRVQAVIVCPTRELADQVSVEIRRLARGIANIKITTLCGGMPFGPQATTLTHGTHIVVGTPGRIDEHLRKNTLNLSQVHTLVLDEADRMLEMGFQAHLDALIEQIPNQRQTLLFSATFPKSIDAIAQRVMQTPQKVTVESTHQENVITQHFYKVKDTPSRLQALRLVLLDNHPEMTVIFCNTKQEVRDVAEDLNYSGFSILELHGDMTQKERDLTLIQFANKSASILVATDVASRGLDIDQLDAVINFHIARDAQIHIHRIGRTGRAGNKGLACSFFNDQDQYKIETLSEYLQQEIKAEPLPKESVLKTAPMKPTMYTIQLEAGKKQKIRPGDILGALTGENGIKGQDVGKIVVKDYRSYVAVSRAATQTALKKLNHGKLKGRSVRANTLG